MSGRNNDPFPAGRGALEPLIGRRVRVEFPWSKNEKLEPWEDKPWEGVLHDVEISQNGHVYLMVDAFGDGAESTDLWSRVTDLESGTVVERW